MTSIIDKKIKKGLEQYFEFCNKVGLRTADIRTPHTIILVELGSYKPNSLEFIRRAIRELHDDFYIFETSRKFR